ncbi:MAG: hypothetical protein K0R25_125 [Rickettsiaceae bacterium]|jgi:hypothetical protein|nr:hypothetical protein [Rickettsiaceae bacterium]
MIRNIFYSLFLHFILLLLFYFGFSFGPKIEIEKTPKVTIDFIAKVGNSTNESEIKIPSKTAPVKNNQSQKEVSKVKKPNKKAPAKPQAAKPKAKPQPKIAPKEFKPKEPDAKSEEDSTSIEEVGELPSAKKSPEKPKEKKAKPEMKEKPVKEEVKKVEKPKEEPKKEEVLEEEEEETEDEGEDEEDDIGEYSFTENTIESLDLLAREKMNIKNQIKRCYKRALDESRISNKAVVNAHIVVNKDGVIDLKSVVIKDYQKYSDSNQIEFRQAVDVVMQSLKFCSPIRNLPQDKYDVWKEIDLQFDGEGGQ